jgi:hypothetical protein
MIINRNFVVLVSMGGSVIIACAGSPPSPGGCTNDADCFGSQTCVERECVFVDAGSPDTGAPETGPTKDAAPDTGTCAAVGLSCTESSGCCQTGQGIGIEGAQCISNDGTCHASCSSDSECESGCCAQVDGQTYGVCADSSYCPPPPPVCTPVGDSCSTQNCCQVGTGIGPYGATCANYECSAKCYSSSECSSGCCMELGGESYGACGSPSGHICL